MDKLKLSEEERMSIAMAMSIEESQKPAKDAKPRYLEKANLASEEEQMSIAMAMSIEESRKTERDIPPCFMRYRRKRSAKERNKAEKAATAAKYRAGRYGTVRNVRNK